MQKQHRSASHLMAGVVVGLALLLMLVLAACGGRTTSGYATTTGTLAYPETLAHPEHGGAAGEGEDRL